MSFKSYFLSDIHLKSEDERNTKILLRFFLSVKEEIKNFEQETHIFLVGDIFDFWISNHRYFIDKFPRVIAAIKDLVQSGVNIHYFEGNHDLYLEKFWVKDIGVFVYREPKYFSIGNHTLRVEHGDLIDPDDKGYLFLKSVLNSKPMQWFAHNCPGRLIAKIGERSSQASRSYTSTTKTISENSSIQKIVTYGKKCFAENPFDLHITGHVHIQVDHALETGDDKEKKPRLINLGSWFDTPKVFVLEDGIADFLELN